MKCLYISYDGAMDPLGHSQIIPYLNKLTKRGIYFNLLTFDKPQHLNNATEVKKLEEELAIQGIRWTHLKYHKHPLVFSTLLDVVLGIIASIIIAKKREIDIVHTRGYPPALLALILKKLFKLKFIFDVRGLWADEKVDAGAWTQKGLLYRLTKYLEKKFFLNADIIVVITRKAKDIIKNLPYYKHNPVEIKVIPTCVDLARFKLIQPPRYIWQRFKDRFVIVHLGSVGTWYMLEEVVNFFKIVKKRIKNAFLLVLTPVNVEYAQEILKRSGLILDNFFVTSVKYEKVPEWLSIAKVSIIFVKPCFSKLTSFPTKLGESLACGLPVVINRGIGDTDELVNLNQIGYVVENFDKQNLEAAIEKIERLRAEDKNLTRRCRQIAEEYLSLEKGVNAYFSIYQMLSNRI